MIRIAGVSKRFGRLQVLRGIDLTMERGRVTAIVGPNGSGKTTLLRSLVGLIRPDTGTITWDGRMLGDDPSYREALGYMPQIVRFPGNLTGNELLAMLGRIRQARDNDLELLHELSLEASMDTPFRNLSGGTRQKINAMIALHFRPELLILDEPTSALDPLSSRRFKDKVRRERDRGLTVIMTSHVMSEVESMADDIAVLMDGRICHAGPLPELKLATGEPQLERAIAQLMETRAAA